MQPPQQTYPQYQQPIPPQQTYSNNSSVAIFHIPSDSTNSLYIDGVPNDTNEREVSRNFFLNQTFSDLFRVSNALDLLRRQHQQDESFSYVLLILKMLCNLLSL